MLEPSTFSEKHKTKKNIKAFSLYKRFKKIIEKSHNRKNLHLVECLDEKVEAGGEFGHSHHPAHRTTVLWGRSRAVEGVVL